MLTSRAATLLIAAATCTRFISAQPEPERWFEHEWTILKTPPVIEAGVPFFVDIELPRDGNTCGRQDALFEGFDCNSSFLEISLNMNLQYHRRQYNSQSESFPYCYLAPCVAANVTSVSLTLPADAIPNTDRYFVPYGLQYQAWRPHADIGIEWLSGSFPEESTLFNVTGSKAPAWKRDDQFLVVSYPWDLPCESLACARECEKDRWTGPVRTQEGFEVCVEGCPGFGREKAEMGCVLENARAAPGSSQATTTTTATTLTATGATGDRETSPLAESSPSETTDADSAGGKLGVFGLGWRGLLMGLVLVVLAEE